MAFSSEELEQAQQEMRDRFEAKPTSAKQTMKDIRVLEVLKSDGIDAAKLERKRLSKTKEVATDAS